MSLAIVFPGQGSQSLGMLGDLAAESTRITDTFAEASEALGLDLWRLVQQGPAEDLDRTENTQPALLTAGVALWRCWAERGGTPPAMLAGHSLGEYTALCCAGVLGLADAVRLVAERGRLMQAAVPAGVGAMAAVLGLADEAVRAVCDEAAEGQVVACANFNMPGQVVIAGHREAVERAAELARARGAKRALMLAVSVPSHCALMKPAAEGLAAVLDGLALAEPGLPVVHNVDASLAEGPGAMRERLVAQLAQPVQWVRCVQALHAAGVDTVLECGPGKVLTGLCGRIVPGLRCLPLGERAQFERALAETAA